MEFSFRHELSISELPRLSISELPGERILKLKFPNKKKVMKYLSIFMKKKVSSLLEYADP